MSRKKLSFNKNYVAKTKKLSKSRKAPISVCAILNSWPFAEVNTWEGGYYLTRYCLFKGVNDLCNRGFAKWDTYDESVSSPVKNSLVNILPKDIINLVNFYLVIARPNINKDGQETLSLPEQEQEYITRWADSKRKDKFFAFCLSCSYQSPYSRPILHDLLKHFFAVYSFEEQLIVGLGVFFTASRNGCQSKLFSELGFQNFSTSIFQTSRVLTAGLDHL